MLGVGLLTACVQGDATPTAGPTSDMTATPTLFRSMTPPPPGSTPTPAPPHTPTPTPTPTLIPSAPPRLTPPPTLAPTSTPTLTPAPPPGPTITLITQTACGDGQECYELIVDCQGLASREATVRAHHLSGANGAVIFATGGWGTRFWGQRSEWAAIMASMQGLGFETYETAWKGDHGWGSNNPGEGLKRTTCASAEVVRWIAAELAENPSRMGIVGHSSAAWRIGYGLAVHGLEEVLSVAVMTAGPMMADLPRACLAYATGGALLDYLMGWSGEGDYCSVGEGPEWIVELLEAESLVSSSDGQERDYDYPNTPTFFIQGSDEERANVLPLRFFEEVTSAKTWIVLPDVGHGVPGSPSGVTAIEQALSEGLNEGRLLAETTTFTEADAVPYADDGDSDHLMTVYTPDGEGPFPALVVIHGGAWRGGSRHDIRFEGRRYARRGIAAFSIDYQLSTPELPSWPTNIQDVVCAVRHIKENAAAYNIDPDRVAVLGISAGGNLASLLATLDGNEPFLAGACGNPLTSTRVVLAANYWGAGDLDAYGQSGEGRVWAAEQMIGVSYSEGREKWLEASPHTYISPDDPPFVIAHGTADAGVPFVTSSSFAAQLEAAGVDIDFVVVEGADHGEAPLRSNARLVLEPLMYRLLLLSRTS